MSPAFAPMRIEPPRDSGGDLMAAMLRSLGDGGGSSEKKISKPEKVITWADVIGQEDAKEALRSAIEDPIKHADIYAAFGMRAPKGVLLYGPPGCGKTLLGKAAAGSLSELHKKPFGDGFRYVSCSQIHGKYVGHEQEEINKHFDAADKFHKANGFPMVLFFDEAESMLPSRDSNPNTWVSSMVNAFLTRMDGFDDLKAFVILATNNHHQLDEAATRDGRIDRKIFVGRPSYADTEKMSLHYLKPAPLASKVEVCAEVLAREMFRESYLVGDKPMHAGIDGAMISGVARSALEIAFKEAVAAKLSGAKPKLKVTEAHIVSAVARLYEEKLTAHKNKTPGAHMSGPSFSFTSKGDKND